MMILAAYVCHQFKWIDPDGALYNILNGVGSAILGYYAATLSSPMRATIGMSIFDIVLVPARGYPLDGWKILIHPIVFWITVWVAWPISLFVALITPRQQMVQDLVTGTLMLRRSPMARHWASVRA